jgi:aminopeptidase N
MIATVPSDWVTVSNGKLESVSDAGSGLKTWTWRQSEPASTYLISLVAGEFESSKQAWHGIPVEYYVPHGDSDRIEPTFSRTRDMLTYFSDRLGIPYPWIKYSQTMVDQFVEGGMENITATTLTSRGLLSPALARESLEGSDNLISHEMGHQWFGDLVTTKDWADLWLNEGFATFMAQLWEEHQYGVDNAAYSRWRAQAGWMRQNRLFGVPIVTRDFNDSMEYAGNIYNKGGMVLEMLRQQMGDAAFFHGLQHYLEANRLQNVTTADLVRALEESSHINVDHFFDQWIYGAGAPRFTVTSAYDASARQVKLQVKQTQPVQGHVGLFEVPVDVEIATAGGTKTFPVVISKAEEQFSFSADAQPLMVLFDKGDKILKSIEFRKSPAEWIYQLQNAMDVPDRAEAAQQLGDIKGNDAVVAALGEAAIHDRFWGVRAQAITALGKIGGASAEKPLLGALSNSEPWVREVAVEQLSKFKEDASLGTRLSDISREDKAYRVRAAALTALGQLKFTGAREVLEGAVHTESPDDVLRRAALRALGVLGDEQAVPALREWSQVGKPVRLRTAAIASLGQLDKKDADIESQLIGYLEDTDFDIRLAAVFALGERGDPAAIAPLEAMRNSDRTPSGTGPMIEQQITRLKNGSRERDQDRGAATPGAPLNSSPASAAASGTNVDRQLTDRLDRLETALNEVNDRLKKIEQQISSK